MTDDTTPKDHSTSAFDPLEWLIQDEIIPAESQSPHPATLRPESSSANLEKDIDTIIARIEATATDITAGYAPWRDLGFALSDALGENGRPYYHRLSRLNPDYKQTETDRQYNRCLRSKGHGITIRTFFQLAKDHGISISVPRNISPISPVSPSGEIGDLEEKEDNPHTSETPTFSDRINISTLPELLCQIADCATSVQDADLLLLGSIVSISACLPNISGLYADREVFPNLYLFISAQASAGKGRLSLCRRLVEPLHDSLRELYSAEKQQWREKKNEWEAGSRIGEQPAEPKRHVIIIPANGSSTAVYELLHDSDGRGLIFETEGDTLANTFKSDYGNFSDGFRKAFHHETISYTRRKDKEFVEIKAPRLSAVLSGTPRQIHSLIPDAENGLFSRFIFYTLSTRIIWQDVFAHTDSNQNSLDARFLALGHQLRQYHDILAAGKLRRFTLTPDQAAVFNTFFETAQQEAYTAEGTDIVGSVRRMGLITFRTAMILSSLRAWDEGLYSGPITCSQIDFQTVMTIIPVLLEHTRRVFNQLPVSDSGTGYSRNEISFHFLSALPHQFDRRQYLDTARSLAMPAKTAEKHIARFLAAGKIIRLRHGCYQKKEK